MGSAASTSPNMEDRSLAFVSAAKDGALTEVKRLVSDCGVDVDYGNGSALMWACYQGHQEVVDYLLSAGATVNCINEENETALHMACRFGFVTIVEALIKRGAVTSHERFKEAPLDLFVHDSDREYIQAVIDGRNI